MLDPESKTRFYLQISPEVKNYGVQGKRDDQTVESLMQAWPMLKNKDAKEIIITRKIYEAELKKILPDYEVVEAKPSLGERLLKIDNLNAPVAFVPKQVSI